MLIAVLVLFALVLAVLGFGGIAAGEEHKSDRLTAIGAGLHILALVAAFFAGKVA